MAAQAPLKCLSPRDDADSGCKAQEVCIQCQVPTPQPDHSRPIACLQTTFANLGCQVQRVAECRMPASFVHIALAPRLPSACLQTTAQTQAAKRKEAFYQQALQDLTLFKSKTTAAVLQASHSAAASCCLPSACLAVLLLM